MPATLKAPARGITPVGFGDSVGHQMIRVAQEGQKQLSVLLGQWEMIITFFKHAAEVPLCLNPENEELKLQHRAVLTAAMGMGEMLLSDTKSVDDAELNKAGYSRGFLNANVRYLRDTYTQWYVERDPEYLKSAEEQITAALANLHAPDAASK